MDAGTDAVDELELDELELDELELDELELDDVMMTVESLVDSDWDTVVVDMMIPQ